MQGDRLTDDKKSESPTSEKLGSTINGWLNDAADALPTDGFVYTIIIVGILLVLLWLVHLFLRFLVFRPIARSRFALKRQALELFLQSRVLSSLATVASLLLINVGLNVIPRLDEQFVNLTHRILLAVLVLAVAQLIVRVGRFADEYASSSPKVDRERAFRGYVSVGTFVIYVIAIILIVSVLVAKSPVYLLTGVGALSAIILIIFRETLLSLFANIVVTTNDLVRVGDWIDVRNTDANGFVIDITLNVVQVRNFNKTITNLPTYQLLQNSFVNYRGMFEFGGRRLKRSVVLDQRTIRMLSREDLEQLHRMPLVEEALELVKESVEGNPECADGLQVTNSALFRLYVLVYLRQHPKIQHVESIPLMVRQLEPTEHGLPIELYAFTTDPAWVNYETVQAGIFDHLLAVLPAFGLRVYQMESDFREPEPVSRRVELMPDALVSIDERGGGSEGTPASDSPGS